MHAGASALGEDACEVGVADKLVALQKIRGLGQGIHLEKEYNCKERQVRKTGVCSPRKKALGFTGGSASNTKDRRERKDTEDPGSIKRLFHSFS